MAILANAAVPMLLITLCGPPRASNSVALERQDGADVVRGTATITSSSGSLSPSREPRLVPLSLPISPTAQRGAIPGLRSGWFKRMMSELGRDEDSEKLTPPRPADKTPISDALLVSRCRSLLLAEPALRNLWIHVDASRGLITLRGEVLTEGAKRHAESIAAKTPNARGIVNGLVVSGHAARAHHIPAALSVPQSLSGQPLPAAAATRSAPGAVPAFGSSPLSQPSVSSGAVVLRAPVGLSQSSGLPEVRSYVIDRSEPIVATTWTTMPPVLKPTRQQVAKTPAGTLVLPSGHRMGIQNGSNVIPAPGGRTWSSGTTTAEPTSPAVTGRPVVRAATRGQTLEQRIERDVAALLALDPRAAGLSITVRGAEVRLAGQARTPEDLYDLSQRISAVPGIDFVSFDDVRFTN